MRHLTLILLSTLISAQLWAQTPVFQLSLKLEPWIRSCANTRPETSLVCQIPQSFHSGNLFLKTQLSFPEKEGHIHHVTLPFASANGSIKGEARLYAVRPKQIQNQPDHIQIQIETIFPIRSLCTQTVRLKTPMEFPLFACTGIEASPKNSKAVQQLGLNVWIKVFNP